MRSSGLVSHDGGEAILRILESGVRLVKLRVSSVGFALRLVGLGASVSQLRVRLVEVLLGGDGRSLRIVEVILGLHVGHGPGRVSLHGSVERSLRVGLLDLRVRERILSSGFRVLSGGELVLRIGQGVVRVQECGLGGSKTRLGRSMTGISRDRVVRGAVAIVAVRESGLRGGAGVAVEAAALTKLRRDRGLGDGHARRGRVGGSRSAGGRSCGRGRGSGRRGGRAGRLRIGGGSLVLGGRDLLAGVGARAEGGGGGECDKCRDDLLGIHCGCSFWIVE